MTQHPQKGQAKKKRPKPATPATAPKTKVAPALRHEPGVSSRSVDVVGVLPRDVHADPEITEGHAGYDESGPSEIRSPEPPKGDKPK